MTLQCTLNFPLMRSSFFYSSLEENQTSKRRIEWNPPLLNRALDCQKVYVPRKITKSVDVSYPLHCQPNARDRYNFFVSSLHFKEHSFTDSTKIQILRGKLPIQLLSFMYARLSATFNVLISIQLEDQIHRSTSGEGINRRASVNHARTK